ncbi:hypothetical protein [Bdellovibrio svalbardensis]|uniref:Lipoprotein n=1 Tax=Bdellovibrio svalbardensis TaxID=2972972 RepID=A0ABT6DFU4_9BACT|nr:hypothetical protein [Bdellovibrio svalbardensis]MDG0815120.1 hypothetical protein [Bdellovibrio svalbardensis]
MKFLSMALVGLLTLSITACEKPEETKSKVNPDNELVNETDYSVCHISPAPHSIEGTWYMTQSQGPFRFVTTFQIANGAVQLTNDCVMNDMTLRAQVSAPASYDHMTFQPMNAAYDVQNIENPTFKMSCEARLSTTKMNYTFDGNCLVFYQQGKSDRLTLAPR